MRALSILLVTAGVASADPDGLLKSTTSGPIHGFTFSRESGDQINAWRGIPYAAAPVDSLRWERPQVPMSWTDPLSCTEFGSVCVQPDGYGSEDCLYLNVYNNPSSNFSKAPQPVLFYIHGGSLMGGSGEYDMTAVVAKTGVIVVELNYRLNIFGFLAVQELTEVSEFQTSGNYGIIDQQMALRWVQDNIHEFNGDPGRVTVMGQSSGGTSIFALMSSPLSEGLFSAAISLSGSPNVTMSLNEAHEQNKNIVKSSGCEEHTTALSVVACMKSLSANELVQLIPDSWQTPGLWNLPSDPTGQHFAGLPVVDGKVLSFSFDEALAQGVIDVPLLIGNTAQEPDIGPERDVSHYSLEEWKLTLIENFKDFNNGSQIALNVYDIYEDDAKENAQKAFDSFVTDYGITCATVAIARTVYNNDYPTNTRKASMYAFFNDWALSHPYSFPGSDYEVRYAYHTIDLMAFTENWQEIGGGYYDVMPSDFEMSKFLQNLFYEFISKNGVGVEGLSQVQAYGDDNYFMYVISRSINDQTTGGGKMIENFKKDICSYFEVANITGKPFWWVN